MRGGAEAEAESRCQDTLSPNGTRRRNSDRRGKGPQRGERSEWVLSDKRTFRFKGSTARMQGTGTASEEEDGGKWRRERVGSGGGRDEMA